MHHTLKLYSGKRRFVLRLYIILAALTYIPLLGRLVRRLANNYGHNLHRAYLLTPKEAFELVNQAKELAVTQCDCRRVFKSCKNPLETEILLGPARQTIMEARPKESREITHAEAEEILREGQRRGLVFTILKCREDFYAICCCCFCCCVPLRLSREYGIGGVLVRHKDIVKEYLEFQSTRVDNA